MLSFYQILKNIFVLAWGHKREAAEAILVFAFLILGWRYNVDKKKLQQDVSEAHGLAANLSQQITFKNNELETVKRDSNGKIVYRNVYVPPEGSVQIDQQKKDALQAQVDDLTARLKVAVSNGNTKDADKIQKEISNVDPGLAVTIVDHGWAMKPGYGLDWANQGIKPRLDFKWAYYKRYGLIFGGGENGVGPGISRHIDDLVPGNFSNLEVFTQWSAVRFYPNGSLWTIGARSNF